MAFDRNARVSGRITIVTGVAGFLGSAVARALAADGRRLRGIVRGSSPRGNLADFPGELVEADLRDEGAVRAAMAGVGALFHVARRLPAVGARSERDHRQ